MNPRLIALSGPLKERVFPITADGVLTIGRAAGNVICLDDELVGREHAKVFLMNGRALLIDERSLNGTSVDGEIYSQKFFDYGDRPKFGSSVFLYYDLDEPAETLPSVIEEELDRSRKAPTLRADYSRRRGALSQGHGRCVGLDRRRSKCNL